jgi:hypothetical protein
MTNLLLFCPRHGMVMVFLIPQRSTKRYAFISFFLFITTQSIICALSPFSFVVSQDKVVSWHATPFEERLLKVLSSEKPSLERYLPVLMFVPIQFPVIHACILESSLQAKLSIFISTKLRSCFAGKLVESLSTLRKTASRDPCKATGFMLQVLSNPI